MEERRYETKWISLVIIVQLYFHNGYVPEADIWVYMVLIPKGRWGVVG